MSETPNFETPPDGPTELPADPTPADPTPPPHIVAEAPKEKPTPEPAYKFDPRNDIYARRSKALAADQAQSDEMFNEGRAAGSALPGREEQPPVASGEEFVTIKVYGEERRAPKADVERAGGVAAYQKTAAADVKLQRAAEREAAIKAEEQRLLRIAENLRNGLDENGQPFAPKPPSPGVPVSKEALEGTVKALYSGDADEATEALGRLIEQIGSRQGTSNPVSPEIVSAVQARVLDEWERRERAKEELSDVEKANQVFQESFKDIADDPEMMIWAKAMAMRLTADPDYQGKSRAEIAFEVGNRIRERTGQRRTETQSRELLKESLHHVPSGSGRMPRPEPKRFMTNAEYIEQLRRNSGSNSAPR
jgi:hypothetical protein